jgi:hypothetical protein
MAIEAPVTSSLQVAQLQQQLDAARPGAVIHLPAGTMRGCLVIDKPLTLRGAGAEHTVLDGWGRGPVLCIEASEGDVRIEELTISGGRGSMGGGVSVDNGARVHLSGCMLHKNAARTGRGGAVAVDRGFVRLHECTVVDNRAQLGGAIFVGGDGKVELSASILADNVAVRGGALAAVDDAELEVWTSRLERNYAEVEGHHLYTYGSLSHAPRIAVTNTMLGAVDNAGLAIANHRTMKASIVLEDSSVARDLLPTHLVG